MDNATEHTVENLVALLARELKAGEAQQSKPEKSAASASPKKTTGYTAADYPILQKHADSVKTPTGKSISDITLDHVLSGKVDIKDVRISDEMLLAQAQVAESAGKAQLGQNLRRAAELTRVPDDTIIKMYDMLRPNRSTKAQLQELEQTLQNSYHAPLCAQLVHEAAEVYEKRGILHP
ncbi:diol dehydratase small subunit [Caproiciproducens sp. LBM24188]|jgi:propanediol dehydratase small subunit|nr:diol dehydratase small subunit [Oscillospiraceae bacterium]HHV32646.1 diol dehydratase small subunit [Clostridiales bacterium]